jgi:hypothetical protein
MSWEEPATGGQLHKIAMLTFYLGWPEEERERKMTRKEASGEIARLQALLTARNKKKAAKAAKATGIPTEQPKPKANYQIPLGIL